MKIYLITRALALVTAVSGLAIEKRANPWQARHGMTSAQYQTVFNDLVSQGYRLNYVSGYTINDVAAYAAIFEKKESPAWVARHGLTSADYQTAFNTYVAQGYRLVLVNAYNVQGVDYYAAIWDKSPSGAWVARHGMTSSDYQSQFDLYTSQGYKLAHVSGYSIGTGASNSARYAALWTKVTSTSAWVARHGLTSSQYQTAFDTYNSQGYRLKLVSGYQVAGVDYYAAFWDRAAGPAYVTRHGLTSAQYQTAFNDYVSQGYILKVVSGYNQGQSDRYAGIWEKA